MTMLTMWRIMIINVRRGTNLGNSCSKWRSRSNILLLLEMKRRRKRQLNILNILKQPPPKHHPLMAKDILSKQNLVITNILPLPKDQIFYWGIEYTEYIT